MPRCRPGRLFGAELGSAFVQTFVRVREQVYSNLVGLHVTVGSVPPVSDCRITPMQ